MTRLMERAIEELRRVPEPQQDGVAEFLLHELAGITRATQSARRYIILP